MEDPELDDPGALSQANATELERRLLEAARAESISPELKARMGRALHSSALTGASGPLWTTKAGVLSLISAAVLAAAVGLRMAHFVRKRALPEASAPVAARAPSAPTPPALAQDGTAVASAAPAAEHVDAPLGLPAGKRAPASSALAVSARADELRAEVALLDGAREALRDGAAERALEALARYERRFARGTLVPEADALRVEALMQSGAEDRARALARHFLATYPTSPLAKRVERAVALHGPR